MSEADLTLFAHLVNRPDDQIDLAQAALLIADDLRTLYQAVTRREDDPDPRLLAPAERRGILLRVLTNLRNIYQEMGDAARLRGVLERMAVLAPGDRDLRRALEQAGGAS